MFRNWRLVWLLLAVCLLIGFIAVAYPMYVIRPFRAQGAGELTAALEVRRCGRGRRVCPCDLEKLAESSAPRGGSGHDRDDGHFCGAQSHKHL